MVSNNLSPNSQIDEVAAILAAGVQRFLQRRSPTTVASVVVNSPNSEPTSLEDSLESRLTVFGGVTENRDTETRSNEGK